MPLVTRQDLPSLDKAADALTQQSADQNALRLRSFLQGELAKQQQDRNLPAAQQIISDNAKQGRKVNVSLSPEGGVSLSQADMPPNPMAQIRAESLKQGKAENLSKRYQNINGFNSALQEIEALTNREGGGGIITNPDAKLQSVGKVSSVVPSGALGLGELLGVTPKGTAEERKALDRLTLEYQKAMTGLRPTDQARSQEKSALGYIASGDPSLVAKGVRTLARNMRNAYKTIQAGYTPEVQQFVHSQMGNPLDMYSSLYEDAPGAVNPGVKSSGIVPTANAGSDKPKLSFEDFKKLRAAGKL